MTTYKIIKAKGLKFEGKNNAICELQKGFVLEVVGEGFVSFMDANEKNGVKSPYVNTKKVLQSILDDGGLVNFSNVEFLKAI